MKINLTAVNNPQLNSTNRTNKEKFAANSQPAYYKPLDPNIVSVKSNAVHYKLIREDHKGAENNINLPISPSRFVNLFVDNPISKINHRLEQHVKHPVALSAIDNAYFEETSAKDRDEKKKQKVEDFLAQTKANIIKREEEIKQEHDKINEGIANKIKKLLEDTIEFSQKTNNIDKRQQASPFQDAQSQNNGPIRDLVRQSTDKLKRDFVGKGDFSSGEFKSAKTPMQLVERQSEMENEILDESEDLGNEEFNKVLRQVKQVRQTLGKKVGQQDIQENSVGYYLESQKNENDTKFWGHMEEGQEGSQDLDKLKSIIREYAINLGKPRDFNADLPILQTLGAQNYDKLQDISTLQIQMDEALKKFQKDWKTLDQDKINYLMKYGIVQEVMKVEERKNVRRDAKTQQKSPVKQGNNLDILNVHNSEERKGHKGRASIAESSEISANIQKKNYEKIQSAQVSQSMLKNNDSKVLGQQNKSSISPSPQNDRSKQDISADAFKISAKATSISFQKPLSTTGVMQKDAPTLGNPLMAKMDFQAKQQRKGSMGHDTASRHSKNVKTMSGKSKQEEDLENMSIEEIEVLVEKAQREIEQALDIKRRIKRHKMMTKKMKAKKLKPVEDTLFELGERVRKLQMVKDAKIPFYEKLPKDSPFYQHYMSVLFAARMQEAAARKVLEDRNFLQNAVANMADEIKKKDDS